MRHRQLAVSISAKQAGRLEQIGAQVALLFAYLMRRKRLVAQVLRLLPVEWELGERKSKPRPKHLVAPLNANATLQPLDQIWIQMGRAYLAQHNNDQPALVVVPERLQVSVAEVKVLPLAAELVVGLVASDWFGLDRIGLDWIG